MKKLLIALMLLVLLAAPLLWYYATGGDGGGRYAVRYFLLEPQQHPIVDGLPVMDQQRAESWIKTRMALMSSPHVVSSAINQPEIGKDKYLSERADLFDWVLQHIAVVREEGASVVELRVHHPTAPEKSLLSLADALGSAFQKEVQYSDALDRKKPRDILAEAYSDLDREISRKSSAYFQQLEEQGTGGSEANRVLIDLATAQINRLQDEVLRLEKALFEQSMDSDPGQSEGELNQPAGEASDPKTQRYRKRISDLQARIKELSHKAFMLSVGDFGIGARKRELEALEEIQHGIAGKIEMWDIELRADPRLRPMGRASFHEDS